MDSEDSWQLHAADTIRDGSFINDPKAVEILCKNAPKAIKELSKWGTRFAKDKSGKIIQRFFGAATYRRACFIGDQTGKEILNVLVDQALKRKIRFKSEVYIFSLLTQNGKVNGAIGLEIKTGKMIVFHARVVVLATGGHSRMFSRSSSRFWENNGDGIALAFGCHAKFMDMEMFQYHPTGMVYPPQAEGVLVTESIRGEGGILTNAKGERFMHKYDSERLELSARDVVARAIYLEVERGKGTKHGGVWLDISHKPRRYILKRLPKMYKQFKEYAHIDISKEKMEVAPTAHYSMGGIYVNHATGKSTVPNLFAIGEVTSGMHGGNRLGGNSLAEIIVFGRLTGRSVIQELKKVRYSPLDNNLIEKRGKELKHNLGNKKGVDPITIKKEIQQMMWRNVGVVRNGKHLKLALKELDKFKKVKLDVGNSLSMNEKLIAALDIRNMFPTCEMIIKSALFRKESRGAHYRSDYPRSLERWRKNILCIPMVKGMKIKTKQISKVPKEIALLLNKEKAETHLLE